MRKVLRAKEFPMQFNITSNLRHTPAEQFCFLFMFFVFILSSGRGFLIVMPVASHPGDGTR